MCKCNSCKYLFTDSSVGYWECKKEYAFTYEEYEEVIEKENYEKCSHYEKYEENDYYPPYEEYVKETK